ncbi:MAG: hypothetical protein HY670_07010 [Chloroflexi bacterium]|nr:hypothetical protein [Chloroflexota bacterium]
MDENAIEQEQFVEQRAIVDILLAMQQHDFAQHCPNDVTNKLPNTQITYQRDFGCRCQKLVLRFDFP